MSQIYTSLAVSIALVGGSCKKRIENKLQAKMDDVFSRCVTLRVELMEKPIYIFPLEPNTSRKVLLGVRRL